MTAATAPEEDRREDHVPRPCNVSAASPIPIDPDNEKVGYPVPQVDASEVFGDELALTRRDDGPVARQKRGTPA
jgi:hypothetical protein